MARALTKTLLAAAVRPVKKPVMADVFMWMLPARLNVPEAEFPAMEVVKIMLAPPCLLVCQVMSIAIYLPMNRLVLDARLARNPVKGVVSRKQLLAADADGVPNRVTGLVFLRLSPVRLVPRVLKGVMESVLMKKRRA